MWCIVEPLQRRPAVGTGNPTGGLAATLGLRRALRPMNHIARSRAPCREPPQARPQG